MNHRGCLLLLLGCLTRVAAAADTPSRAPLSVDMLQWLLALCAVLVALFVFAWLLRRFSHFSRLEPGSFRVLAALSLGARERVVLVQAGAKQLVLGVAPGRIETLCVLEGDDAIALGDGEGSQPLFAQQLKTLVSGRTP